MTRQRRRKLTGPSIAFAMAAPKPVGTDATAKSIYIAVDFKRANII
jgi:hypothetical protein